MNRRSIGKDISILQRYSTIYLDKRLVDYDIKAGSVSIFSLLLMKEGISQLEIAKELSLDKGTVTRNVAKLIEKGYVVRESNPDDRRAYKLYVTKKGVQIKEKFYEILGCWSTQLVEGFSDEEIEMVYKLTKKMSENAKKISQGNL